MASRAFCAASAAFSRLWRAFSFRKSRVSFPEAGAYSKAIAAPATAPSKNARRTWAPSLPCSFAIPHLLRPALRAQRSALCLAGGAPRAGLKDAYLHVQVLPRVLPNVLNERQQLAGRLVHVLI